MLMMGDAESKAEKCIIQDVKNQVVDWIRLA